MSEPTERIPAAGLEILEDLKSFLVNKAKMKEALAHIKKPYSVSEIRRIYLSGAYDAELLLQHTLLQLEK